MRTSDAPSSRRRRAPVSVAVTTLALAFLGCGGAPGPVGEGAPPDRGDATQSRAGTAPTAPVGPELVVLGTGQDGGVPHAACSCPRCERAAVDPAFRRRGPSLGIRVPGSRPWIVDASPEFPEQLRTLAPGDIGRVDRDPLAGVFLTHAHVGHYLGLAHLGREVVGARGTAVYATPAMAAFLEAHAPWQQLVALGNVALRPTAPGTSVEIGAGVRVTSFRVPHRDEYADTVGYRIEGPDLTVLYVPDTDRWDGWDPPFERRLDGVDVALLDGTFHGLAELPGRTLADVPHPPMTVTMDRLQDRVDGGLRVVFTHLNHSNPAVDPDSPEARACRDRGFEIARDGDVLALGGTTAAPR